jgi:hypothetical protein
MTNRNNVLIILTCMLIGVFSFLSTVTAQECTDNDNDGYAVEGGICGAPDCDDTNNSVYPGAPLLCDGLDNNCDTYKDFKTDEDKDGDGEPWCAGDCNDNDANLSHNILEGPYGDAKCSDGIDNDCDGRPDDRDSQCKNPCTDVDGDGYGYLGKITCPNGPETDCNDNDASINPGAMDANCNNIDENCDGIVDEGYVMTITNCGYGNCSSTGLFICSDGVEIDTCVVPESALPEGPNDDPTCYDNIDNDCDGETDSDDTNCIKPCMDNDGDGYGNPGNPDCPNGPVIDCNDNDPAINPDHIVNCDSTNNNCYSYAALTWEAPVTNMDESDLTDLAGYRIYYGEGSDNYTEVLDVGNNICHVIGNLTPQEWCFAVTAYDIAGNESAISIEVCKFIN